MKITVSKKDAVSTFETSSGEKILYAGLRQGLSLPHECATGTCGSCKATLKSGRLNSLWPSAPGAKSFKPGKNEFLMCQNSAATDCEISFRGKLESEEDVSRLPQYYSGQIVESGLLTQDVMRLIARFDHNIPYKAGQFVVVNVDGLEGGRAYSMVNCPQDGTDLELIVKQMPGGGFSEWLFDKDRNDAKVSIFGPLGLATLGSDEGKDILCITGGSGIAGIVALLTQAVNDGYFLKNRGHLFFGVRTYQDLFFHNRLVELSEKANQKLKITFTFSQNGIPNPPPDSGKKIEYLKGDVTPLAMERMQNDLENTLVFLAGPPPMVDDAIRRLVIDSGFPVNDIRYDKFG